MWLSYYLFHPVKVTPLITESQKGGHDLSCFSKLTNLTNHIEAIISRRINANVSFVTMISFMNFIKVSKIDCHLPETMSYHSKPLVY